MLLLDLLAAVLVLYSVSLIFLSNFNMGNLMVWLLTVCVAGYAVFRRSLNLWFSAGAGRVVFWVLAVLAGVYLALIAFVGQRLYEPPTGDERVIIVLGAGLHKDKPSKLLQCRLNKAYDYAAAHPETLVITSGGQGPRRMAARGRRHAGLLDCQRTACGPRACRIRSTSTEENFAFSLTILREHGFDETTPIVYVSNAFHCYRAGKYAALAGFTKPLRCRCNAAAQCAAMLSAGGTGTALLLGIQNVRQRTDACDGRLAGAE